MLLLDSGQIGSGKICNNYLTFKSRIGHKNILTCMPWKLKIWGFGDSTTLKWIGCQLGPDMVGMDVQIFEYNSLLLLVNCYNGSTKKGACRPLVQQNIPPIIMCQSMLLLCLIRLDYQYYYLWSPPSIFGIIWPNPCSQKNKTLSVFTQLKFSLDILFILSKGVFWPSRWENG